MFSIVASVAELGPRQFSVMINNGGGIICKAGSGLAVFEWNPEPQRILIQPLLRSSDSSGSRAPLAIDGGRWRPVSDSAQIKLFPPGQIDGPWGGATNHDWRLV